MSNITFFAIENNVQMYGFNQIGVYVDGELKYYITESDFGPKMRIFTYPENYQLGAFTNKYKPEDYSVMRFLVLDRFSELQECEKERWSHFIKIIFVNGLHGSISRDHLGYGAVSLMTFGHTADKFSLKDIEMLKKFIETKPDEFKTVSKIEIIKTTDFSIETININ